MKQLHTDIRESVILENHGQKIFGVLHKPVGLDRFPAVLICHGFGGHKVGRYRLYVNIAKRLAELGIATLRIDFRGSGDSEGEFSEMTLEGEISDALQGLHFLNDYAQVDRGRIGLIGRSLGGAVAIMAASRFQHVKSICLWAPIYSSSQWYDKWQQLHSGELHAEHKEHLMTVEGQKPGFEFFKQFFMMNIEDYLPTLQSVPLFLIHGRNDQVVNPNHSEKYLHTRLNAVGETKFIELPLSDHDFTPPSERHLAMEETCFWFKQTL